MAPKWSVESISGTQTAIDDDREYGNKFVVTFEMVYERSLLGSFEEMPLLDWHETITHQNGALKTWWTFDVNMYQHKRTCKTLNVWTQRYIIAYDTAMGLSSSVQGSSTLYSKSVGGIFTKVTDLPKAKDNKAKADAVRNFLKKNGGKLVIVIIDRALLSMDPNEQRERERLLVFDTGVQIPGSLKWIGYQHLVVNGNTKTCNASTTSKRPDLVRPSGWTQVEPGPEVSDPYPTNDTMYPGECW